MKNLICPTCHQNMNEMPQPGLNGKDCPQCGQGISWRRAAAKKRKVAADEKCPDCGEPPIHGCRHHKIDCILNLRRQLTQAKADLRTQGESCSLQIDENKRLRADELEWLAERKAITEALQIERMKGEEAAPLDWVLVAIQGLRNQIAQHKAVVEKLVAMVAQAHPSVLSRPCGCNWCVSNWHTYTAIARMVIAAREAAAGKKGEEGK